MGASTSPEELVPMILSMREHQPQNRHASESKRSTHRTLRGLLTRTAMFRSSSGPSTAAGKHVEDEGNTWMEMKLRISGKSGGNSSASHDSSLLGKLHEEDIPETADTWRAAPPIRHTFIVERLRALIRAFGRRAQKFKTKIKKPITPSPSPPPLDLNDEDVRNRLRLDSLIMYKADTSLEAAWMEEQIEFKCCSAKRRYLPMLPPILDPQSKVYIFWLFIVTVCFLYNAFGIFIRAIFRYQTEHSLPFYLFFDYISDLVYILDIAVFKIRVKFLQNGLWAEDQKTTRTHYWKQSMFKIQTFWEFFNRVDAVAKAPYVIRVLRSLIYMMYLIHLNACAYYAMSEWEGIGSNKWVFQGKGNAYIRCFYFATKTATSIGKNPKPQNEYEYVFMTFSWLMGVFVFAFLIGQIRDIVATATQNKTKYRELQDHTIRYMRNLNLPDDLQKRVRLWLTHTWEQQKVFNENQILDSLPHKMKTDLALSVHYNTISKVELFKDCERALLRDLVLKLKPVLFLPGDFICYKGEVGQEMYIVNTGHVQVIADDGETVLATLMEGSVFGELCVLGLPESRRRLCDVRSKGFSSLFVLTKSDLWDTLKNYPDGQDALWRKVRGMAQESSSETSSTSSRSIDDYTSDDSDSLVIIRERRPSTPKLVKTVMQVLPADFKCAQIIRRRSSVISRTSVKFAASHETVSRKESLPRIDITSPQGMEHSLTTQQLLGKRPSLHRPERRVSVDKAENKNRRRSIKQLRTEGQGSEDKQANPLAKGDESQKFDSDLINEILLKLPTEIEEEKDLNEITDDVASSLKVTDSKSTIQTNENSEKANSSKTSEIIPPIINEPTESNQERIMARRMSRTSVERQQTQESHPWDSISPENAQQMEPSWNLFNLSTLSLHSLFQTSIPEVDELLEWSKPTNDENLHTKISRSISETLNPTYHAQKREGEHEKEYKAGYDNLAFTGNDKISRSHSNLSTDNPSC